MILRTNPYTDNITPSSSSALVLAVKKEYKNNALVTKFQTRGAFVRARHLKFYPCLHHTVQHNQAPSRAGPIPFVFPHTYRHTYRHTYKQQHTKYDDVPTPPTLPRTSADLSPRQPQAQVPVRVPSSSTRASSQTPSRPYVPTRAASADAS